MNAIKAKDMYLEIILKIKLASVIMAVDYSVGGVVMSMVSGEIKEGTLNLIDRDIKILNNSTLTKNTYVLTLGDCQFVDL